MAQAKKDKTEKPLTEVELELMNVIWGFESCTVKDVQSALPATRDLAYTSVATMMKILEQKGFLTSTRGDRAHLYAAGISRADYEAASLRHLAANVFQGDPRSMVMRMLDESDLSRKEVEAIRAILAGKEKA
jgi:predicted transcriptional regulator